MRLPAFITAIMSTRPKLGAVGRLGRMMGWAVEASMPTIATGSPAISMPTAPTIVEAAFPATPTMHDRADHQGWTSAAEYMPTIEDAASASGVGALDFRGGWVAPYSASRHAPGTGSTPPEVAAEFLVWAIEHNVPGADGRQVAVDDLWWLVSEDFGPALDIPLPPRRVFLGSL